MKYFLLICSLLILPFSLFASQDDLTKSKGTTQDVIVQLMPSPAQEGVSRYTKIEASFNVPLDVKHVKKFDVKLKCFSCKKKNNIQGTVGYSEADKKVIFTPSESLTPGVYEVEFKSLKADKAHKKTKIKEIKYRFVVVEEVLERLTVVPATVNLIEGETVQLTVTGKYDNGIEKKMMSQVAWIVGDSQTISVDDNGLATALKAGNTTIQAKLTGVVEAGEVVSNDVPVEVLIPDVVPPVITLNGEKTMTLHQDAIYEELGATALDERDGNVSVTITGTVDTSTVGNYTITYLAQDSVGNEANITRGVTVIDVTPPVLTLNGEANITLEQNANYSELGATALDAVDGNVSVNILGNVNTSIVGNYTITYNAQDNVGNEANIIRSVTVIDAIPPIITLNGDANISLSVGESYEEHGASAADTVDGNVSVAIIGNVDTSMVGIYTITYTAQDSIGNEATATRTVTVVAPVLTSISLESNATTLNVGEKAQLTVMGTYSDNSTKELKTDIEWIVTPIDSVDVNGSVLTANKDGDVTVQAKVGNVLSNTLNLTITWVVNGHVLPPEPDPTENDATLLGVDTNSDGVRDDIERKIYATYPKAIQRAVMMQAFRAKQKMLADPDMVDNAREWEKKTWKPIDCSEYVHEYKNQPRIKNLIKILNDWQFNNKERVKLYMDYNKALSGGVYSINLNPILQDCEFDVDEVLEMDK
jgi:hypothetical protein